MYPVHGGAAGPASSPATACGGAVVRSLLRACVACVEKRAREKGEKWHGEEERDREGVYL